MSEEAEDAEFLPGIVLLDKYRVIRELGVGGMSRVLAAEHVTLKGKVALKLLLPELASLPDAPQRFEREALAGARVSSDHIVRVMDVGKLPMSGPGGGTPFIVMEYLEGKDLGRLVKEGKRFEVREAIDLIVQAADALTRAHEAGVVHRDVKPSNLFLTTHPDGSPFVKVLDFGISKLVEEAAKDDLRLTKTTAVMGSAMYMSIEQMRSPKSVDRRTDVWALGVTLYELLSGTHPWTAESFSELCVKVSLDPPEPLRRHRPDVPDALANVIAVAYAQKLEERYQTVGQFVADLAPFASPDTQKRIRAIRELERRSHPDLKGPVRPPQPRLAYLVYAVIAGAGLAAAATLAWKWQRGYRDGVDAGRQAPSGDVVSGGSAGPPVPTIDPSPSAVADAGAVTLPIPSASPKEDAGATRPRDPCAGKPPTAVVILPNGMRGPCSLLRRP